MRSSWTRHGIMAVSAAIMAFQGTLTAVAQYVPYEYAQQQQQQNYAQYQQPSQYQPPVASSYQPQAGYQTQAAYQPQSSYQAHSAPQYRTAMAFHDGAATAPPQTMNMSAEPIGVGQQPTMAPASTHMAPTPTPMATGAPGCQNCQPAASGYQSYDSGCNTGCSTGYASGCDTGCSTGSCYNYNTFCSGDGFYNTGYKSCGLLGSYGSGCGCGRRWFGGVYGLYLERVGNPWKTLAFSTADTAGYGYYPTDTEYVVNLKDIDHDTFSGAEFRLGATFGGGGCGRLGRGNGCGDCCGTCGPNYAWEVAYWGLLEDEVTFTVTDTTTDGTRLYGMKNYDGKTYNGRELNHYYDYAPPTSDYQTGFDDIEVRSFTARNRFSAQNVELNLLRLPILCGGSCGVACGSSCGTSCGGCDSIGCSTGCCDTGCGTGGCGMGRRFRRGCGGCSDFCGPRYSVTTLIGARYLRIDEDFMFRSDYENMDTPGFGWVSDMVDVQNHLVGAQLGCNGVYRLGRCGRWALHCNSVAGLYGNYMEVWNRTIGDAGTGGYANGDVADIRYDDNDLAFIGELRVGGSYQYSCNWRLFGGYRFLGISGVALAYDQTLTPATTAAHASHVDSDGSVILHGLQAGVECTY